MEKIFYSNIESPIGSIWVARSKIGLLRLDFPCEEVKFLKELGAHTETEPEYRPSKLDDIGNWLDGYFKGEKMEYKEPFDLRGTDFQKKVWNAIFDIPHGKLASYGQLAEHQETEGFKGCGQRRWAEPHCHHHSVPSRRLVKRGHRRVRRRLAD